MEYFRGQVFSGTGGWVIAIGVPGDLSEDGPGVDTCSTYPPITSLTEAKAIVAEVAQLLASRFGGRS